ncbi:unnamed protein product [Mytilus edulis]|uniref:Uncharacterized protein n=1 Tax=Mytilus edulis TaxID=6550 RepID=A0A8S3UUV5_MYTED|nr:unnamed protein product [Mytilus edulis]
MDHYYNANVMRRTLRARFIQTKVNTRGQVIEALEGTLVTRDLVAIYKTGEGAEWYLTFATDSQTEKFGDGQRRGLTNDSGAVYFDRIDRRVVKFRIHWFPLHLRKELVLEWLERYGTAIQLEEERDGIQPASSGHSFRQTACLPKVWSERTPEESACPQNGSNTRKSYAESARAGLEDGSGESTRLSVDVPCTSSSEGSTGLSDVLSSSEGSPVRPDGLTTSSGEGTQPSADVLTAVKVLGRTDVLKAVKIRPRIEVLTRWTCREDQEEGR